MIPGTAQACEGSVPAAEQVDHPCRATGHPPGGGGRGDSAPANGRYGDLDQTDLNSSSD